ncbi:MAG: FAD-dependent oxidoreductase, partial [Lutibacter sp.]|nr:FAD-dependent oxidoreductase [Lutibacter sp.]
SARLSFDNKIGLVFIPMHWGKIFGHDFCRANNLTSNLVDHTSKEPDFKFSAVQVSKYKKDTKKICIVGAGAAAYRFIQSYRSFNTTDEILVFSKEEHPFYNRVLLPEYISEDLSWEQLQKLKEGEIEKLNVQLYAGKSITAIDTDKKIITASDQRKHSYDKLIMATGSRAFIPKEVPIQVPGSFTMRDKTDADKLKRYLKETGLPENEQEVVIVGGGLLGLELAASLKNKQINITIIQRAPRLMERQLDNVASRLLAENVQQRGIQIFFDNEVSTIFEDEKATHKLSISLKSGKNIQANAIVYAIGTLPNIELAKNAGVKCRRGVVVNQYLQSNDPAVFALGEIAEFDNALYGITAAAEQQASIAAKFILGDLNSVYRGSVLMNILKFENLDLCSIGRVNAPKNDQSYEEIILMDVSKHFYKKCIVKNDLLIGAILMGDKSEFAEFKHLIEHKIELSDKRTELLRGQHTSRPVLGKLICSCSQVGEGNLIEAVGNGCKNLEELCSKTGAGLGCGSCKPEINELLQKHQ